MGDDATGELLLADLVAARVDVSFVRRGGRSGSIVVLVDEHGERSFLTDPGSARMLDDPDPGWLDEVDVLHVPFYSLIDEPMATTAQTVVGWAHAHGTAVSVDVSSTSALDAYGTRAAVATLERLGPTAVFANADEAATLGIDAAVAGAITFVKHGAGPATLHLPDGASVAVPAPRLGPVADSTGAGDAFAAGVLTHPAWSADPVAACSSGHAAAAALLRSRVTPAARSARQSSG